VKVGIPSETKPDEYRVSMTPAGVRELTERGHEVAVQQGAGDASGFSDAEYAAQGATIAADADAVFAGAEMVVKVKEPLPPEVERLRPGQILFT
jgi:alanine dehydrogenase